MFPQGTGGKNVKESLESYVEWSVLSRVYIKADVFSSLSLGERLEALVLQQLLTILLTILLAILLTILRQVSGGREC